MRKWKNQLAAPIAPMPNSRASSVASSANKKVPVSGVNNRSAKSSALTISSRNTYDPKKVVNTPKVSPIATEARNAGIKYVSGSEICPQGAYKTESTGGLNYRICARFPHNGDLAKSCRNVLKYQNQNLPNAWCRQENKVASKNRQNSFIGKNFKYTSCECNDRVCRSMMTYTCYQAPRTKSTGKTRQK